MLRACIDCGALSYASRSPEHRHRNRNGSTSAWRKLRAAVLKRDGTVCTYCGDPSANEVDHHIPLSQGGTDDMRNRVVARGFCNRSKHAGGEARRKPRGRA
jgi:5-methylcytosine-specific restriction endonuclease McrA